MTSIIEAAEFIEGGMVTGLKKSLNGQGNWWWITLDLDDKTSHHTAKIPLFKPLTREPIELKLDVDCGYCLTYIHFNDENPNFATQVELTFEKFDSCDDVDDSFIYTAPVDDYDEELEEVEEPIVPPSEITVVLHIDSINLLVFDDLEIRALKG